MSKKLDKTILYGDKEGIIKRFKLNFQRYKLQCLKLKIYLMELAAWERSQEEKISELKKNGSKAFPN